MCRHGENIYKRKDGRYEGRCPIGKKPDGTTKFEYIYGRQYLDVRRKVYERRAALASQIEPRSQKKLLFVDKWFETWISEEVVLSVKPSTQQLYESIIRCHINPRLGKMLINEIDTCCVASFIEDLRAQSLSPNTIRCIVRVLSAALEYAFREKHIAKNPCRKVKLPRVRLEQRTLSWNEQSAIAAAAKPDDLPILVGMFTGLRLGEVCGLKWGDIQWDKGTVTISRTTQRLRIAEGVKKTKLVNGTPKSYRSYRTLYLPAPLLEQLKAKQKVSSSVYIFGKQEKPMDPRTLERRLKKLAERAGIHDVHFHTLRHTFATRMIEQGEEANVVRDLLGHASVSTTLDIYTHVSSRNGKTPIARMAVKILHEPS